MSAILLGVEKTLKSWTGVEGVLINTDSQTAISYLKFNTDASVLKRQDWLSFRKGLYDLLDAHACKIRFKFVQGHQRPFDVRAYLNGQVDLLAKERLLVPKE